MPPKKKLPLTEKEKEVWKYLIQYSQDYGFMPTRNEVAKHLDYHPSWGRQAVESFLDSMELKGYVKLGRGWRNIKLII